MTAWRLLLRLAWRDVLRHRGRNAVALVMVLLPVCAVTVADVVIFTAEVRGAEGLDRRLGTADARVALDGYAARIYQGTDPDESVGMEGLSYAGPREVGTDELEQALGRPARFVRLERGDVAVRTDDDRTISAGALALDLDDPLTTGVVDVDEGREPAADDEVVVNPPLRDAGARVGDRVEVGATTLTVVGVGDDPQSRDRPVLVVRPGVLERLGGTAEDAGWQQRTYLVDAGGPVTWDDVLALNDLGASVLSRAVVEDPPSDAVVDVEAWRGRSSIDQEAVAVVVLVVVMALLEIALLAGPAFAVGARRQARSLALLSASGATAAQARWAVVAGGLVVGVLGSVAGVLGGVLLAALGMPVFQRFSGTWFGPLDVRWAHLLGFAACGVVAAVLACVVPAWIASRQDVVAALAGRRGDPPPHRRSPWLGVALVLLGLAGIAGAVLVRGRETGVAAGTVVLVLGTILLVPVVVAGVARVATRLPLPLRFAARDLHRHRTRTTPAVAAVAATVCGVVALGIGTASDAARAEATYAPSLPAGVGIVGFGEGDQQAREAATEAVRSALPDARVDVLRSVDEGVRYLDVRLPGTGLTARPSWGTPAGSVLVADTVPAPGLGLDDAALADADAALAAGRAVVLTSQPRSGDAVDLGLGDPMDGDTALQRVPATYVTVTPASLGAAAVLPPSLAAELDLPVEDGGLLVSGTEISRAEERAVDAAVGRVLPDQRLYVERGYRTNGDLRLELLVLAGVAALLMLGGTLTATALALSDARPDLATLAAVGAAPRTRRAVAASYALVVSLVGALLGVLLGLVPGLAAAGLLRTGGAEVLRGEFVPGGYSTDVGPFLAVPWSLLALVVVGLPLLAAALTGLAARSRLPVVRRVG